MRSSLSDPGVVPELAPGLLRLASRLAGSSDAEDLVQSTWLRTLEHRGAVQAPRSWLRRVMVNEQRMQLRGSLRRDAREQSVGDARDAPTSVEDVVHGLEIARIIDGLLSELDDDVQMVVRERYFGGESAAEIARKHRIPAGTVRWRLKSGLDRLRDQLDARYGGRRGVWAGVFVPASMGPTLPLPVASEPSIVGRTVATTGKGWSAMSVKILLAAGLTAAGAGGVAWVASSDVDTQPAPVVETAVAEQHPAKRSGPRATSPEPTQDKAQNPAQNPAQNKAQWAKRLSAIQSANTKLQPPQAPAAAHEGMTWHVADGGEVEVPDGEHVFCPAGEDCLDALAEQVLGLIEGCKDFMDHTGPAVSLTAHVLGAPDVGSIVQSVELSSGDDASEELTECLTESMYTLDLGPTEESFERDITVMIGGEPVDLEALAGADLDEETRAAIEDIVAEHGDEGGARMVFLGHGE